MAEFGDSAADRIQPEVQDELVESWLALRPWLDVVEKD
jgi:hypothetical protein